MARVLIVEDDAAIGQVLQRSLQLEGYEVSLAPDGVAALEQTYDFEPDAVILDLGLPRLDGIDVAKRIRKDSDVPILILTAREGPESRGSGGAGWRAAPRAPTTPSSSRSSAGSCWRACARCCGGRRRAERNGCRST